MKKQRKCSGVECDATAYV